MLQFKICITAGISKEKNIITITLSDIKHNRWSFLYHFTSGTSLKLRLKNYQLKQITWLIITSTTMAKILRSSSITTLNVCSLSCTIQSFTTKPSFKFIRVLYIYYAVIAITCLWKLLYRQNNYQRIANIKKTLRSNVTFVHLLPTSTSLQGCMSLTVNLYIL